MFLLSLLPTASGDGRFRHLIKSERNTMAILGTVKFFNVDKGYGFIAPDNGGGDAFVHISAVERAGMVTLNQNQRVGYELEQDRRGKTSAVNLTAAD
jgi:CspA family cold shock protein